ALPFAALATAHQATTRCTSLDGSASVGACAWPGYLRRDVGDGSKCEILIPSRCFPLLPRKRTQVGHRAMTVKCHFPTRALQQGEDYSITSSANVCKGGGTP